MSHLTLHAQQIRKLTLTKQHIASIAWELDLYSMQNLSASAYRIWHFIRAFAAFDTESYSANLSQEYIAEKLKCSVKTISRAIGEIKALGLIEVQNNVSKLSGTQANTYFITFPKEAYAQAEATSDKVAKFSLPCFTQQQESVSDEARPSHLEAHTNLNTVPAISMALPMKNLPSKQPEGMDIIDHTPPVKSDVPYRDINFIEKNNNVVVFDLSKNEEKQDEVSPLQQVQLTTLLTQLKNERQSLTTQLAQSSQFKSVNDRLSFLKDVLNNRADSNAQEAENKSNHVLQRLNDIDIEIEQVSKQLEKHNIAFEKLQKTQLLHQDPSFVNKLQGDRQLSEQDIQLLLTKLKTLNVSTEAKNQLANEIIYEARFGSLVKNNQTREENPIKRSINIGCKLIRAGQWCTPTKFDQVYQRV